MNSEPDLLPCPFCGGAAETDHAQPYRAVDDGRMGNAAAVYCTRCGVQMTTCYRDVPGIEAGQVMKDLIESWNRRVAP